MADIILKTKKLTKKYGKSFAVNNVNLELKQGDIYGLVGKNGAGKTTILRMISGLSIPTSGELELFNETSKAGLNNSRARIGCMIETPSFFKYLSAKKNLEYYRLQRGVVEKECVDEVLKMVGLEDAGKKKFKNFSMGMKQRLGLALAVMASPDLLVLDEPTNGIDPAGIIEIRELLLKFNRERNTTIIISSHILSELAQIVNTYGFINNGEFVEQISAKNLEEKCKRYLLIKVDDTSKATVIIENKLDCMEYEVLNRNQIRLYQHIDTPEVVSEILINNGIKLFSIINSGMNLEEYFVDLIGGNKHD